jgi:hypothetical protein
MVGIGAMKTERTSEPMTSLDQDGTIPNTFRNAIKNHELDKSKCHSNSVKRRIKHTIKTNCYEFIIKT